MPAFSEVSSINTRKYFFEKSRLQPCVNNIIQCNIWSKLMSINGQPGQKKHDGNCTISLKNIPFYHFTKN